MDIQLGSLRLDLCAEELRQRLHLNVVHCALVEPRGVRGDDDVELLLLNDLDGVSVWNLDNVKRIDLAFLHLSLAKLNLKCI